MDTIWSFKANVSILLDLKYDLNVKAWVNSLFDAIKGLRKVWSSQVVKQAMRTVEYICFKIDTAYSYDFILKIVGNNST